MTNLILSQKYKLFQRLTGWSRDKIGDIDIWYNATYVAID